MTNLTCLQVELKFFHYREERAVDFLCFLQQKRARRRQLDLFPLQKNASSDVISLRTICSRWTQKEWENTVKYQLREKFVSCTQEFVKGFVEAKENVAPSANSNKKLVLD